MRTFYLVLIVIMVMLRSFCSPFQKPDGGDHPELSTTASSEDEKNDTDKRNDQGCISPGELYDPVNLYTDDDFMDGRNASGDQKQWKKLKVNKYYGVQRDRFYVKNSEGMLVIQFRQGEPSSAATIFGTEDDWAEEYILAKANIFFSKSKYHGSQHALRGETFAFELQLVHYRKSIESLADAAGEKHGILVVCILFQSTGKMNFFLDPLASAAIMSIFPSEKFHAAHGPLDIKALFPSDLSNLQYTGQHFAKPCARQAKYVVFISPRTISEKQLKKFREIRDHQGESNPGVWGDFQGESPEDGIKVNVSKNVKLQVIKKEKISLATLLLPSSFVTSVIMAQLLWFILFRFIGD